MARKTSSTPIAANVPDYRTEPITEVPFDSSKLMELFCSYDLKSSPNLARLASDLYSLSSDYEGASRRLDLAIDRLASSVEQLRKGSIPFYNLVNLAIEIDQIKSLREEKRSAFNMICRILGYKIIEGGG